MNYAEIHYKPAFIKSSYFRKHPEIIFDIPHSLKLVRKKFLPVFCIVKDADKFPCTITSVKVYIQSESFCRKSIVSEVELPFNEPYNALQFNLDIPSELHNRTACISVIAEYKLSDNSVHTCINDNYAGMPYNPFRTYICKENDCFPEGWYKGDMHYHSSYTNDQVEFGADIKSAKTAANALGLDWFFVTDHSYDLDDYEGNYLKNDPELNKWYKLRDELRTLSDSEVEIVLAEEASIGSTENKNLHLIAVNPGTFIPGYGDSAETWGKTQPTVNIKDVEQFKPELLIAAHPFEPVSFLQTLPFSFRRSEWKQEDFTAGNVNILQIVNGSNNVHINRSIKKWVKLLLMGQKYSVTAGNDAHGNFGLQRQVRLPFIKLESKKEQLFGKWFTAFKLHSKKPIEGIRKGCIILSNGPFLSFSLKVGSEIYEIGSSAPFSEEMSVNHTTNTTSQYGDFNKILLFTGDCDTGKEVSYNLVKSDLSYSFPRTGYIRMEGYTDKGRRVITNPIYINATS